MTHDIDAYLARVSERLRLSAKERDQVLRELRAHVEEKVADLRAAGRDEATALAVALDDLGAPERLAIAYNDAGTELRNHRGETVLRVGRAVGRGTIAVLKWTAVAVAFLLVVGLVTAYVAYQETKPYIEDNWPRTVYHADRDCSTRCSTLPEDASFHVPDDARRLEADVMVRLPAAGGSVRVVVTDPDGEVAYDRTFTAGTSDSDERDDPTWSPKPGTWRVTTQYAGFAGRLTLDVESIGLRPGSLG